MDNTRNFVGNCRKVRQEIDAGLPKGLQEHSGGLLKNIFLLQEDFKKKEKRIRADLAEASNIWNKMNETLRARKTKKEVKR